MILYFLIKQLIIRDLKILLGYLPINRDEWSKCLQRQRELYKEFVQDLLIENGNIRQSQNDHVRAFHYDR